MNAPSDSGDRPLAGILMMLIGIAAFSVMDATLKWLTEGYSIAQVVMLRSWFGLPLLCLFALYGNRLTALKTSNPGIHFVRYLLVLILSFSFFWALSQMKLVDAIAITFAAPIFITALSVPLLKESVGLKRWLAIAVGFSGVLIMLRPGSGVFQWASIIVLGSVLVYSLLMITTRAYKSSESTASLMLYPQLGMTITGFVLLPFFWKTPDLADLGLFALAGTFGSIGVMCVTHAFRLGAAAVISPFEYSALIWASLLGYLLWDELPDSFTLVGAAVVIASGLYIVYRETLKTGQVDAKLTSMSPDDLTQ
ncbi:MAG: DMT family transporter [Pseudomonadota bacterium]